MRKPGMTMFVQRRSLIVCKCDIYLNNIYRLAMKLHRDLPTQIIPVGLPLFQRNLFP